MHSVWKIFITSVTFFLVFSVLGQRARLFSTDSELSNSLINDIYQDHKGVIWIANQDGITKYDGSKFSFYRENESGILNNYVRTIFEDSKQNLYFGFFSGLQSYDRASDSFTKIPLKLESDSREVSAHVVSLVERDNGEILVGTSGHGIFILSDENGTLVGQQKSYLVPSYFVNKLFEDSKNNLWVSTQDQGLFCLKANNTVQKYYEPKNGIGNNISGICEDQDGNIYVGSLTNGLFKFDKESDNFDRIPNSNFPIQELFATTFNNILVGTDGEGMKLFNLQTNTVSNLNFNVSNFDFSKSKVHAIMQDDVGNYWLGLFQKGVVLIPSKTNNFRYLGYQSVIGDIIGSNYIMSVLRDREGVLWVGTDSDGLIGVDIQTGKQLVHYESEETNNAPSTIMCMFEDSNDNLWIGSYLDGLSRLDRKSGKFIPINLMDEEANPAQKIVSIVEDENKTLWVGTLGFGLFSIDLVSGRIQNFNGVQNPIYPNDAVNRLHNGWINYLMVSNDNKVYIGTTDGISRYDIEDKVFSVLNSEYPILRNQNITSLYQDELNRIWIGTSSGLICYNDSEKRLSSFTVDDGLPSNGISAIQSDEENNIWISTNYGISKFYPEDTTFINYYYHDGLQGNEFSRASFKDENGLIYFGGINGITYFDSEDIIENNRDLTIEVTGFYIQDKSVKKGLKSGKYDIVNTAVIETDTFQLAHHDNSFTIEFSALEYINPSRINFQYSMNNNEWISLQQGTNMVTFNNLEPGTYQFKVRAKDFKNYSDTKILWVIIHPVWYFSPWAKFIYSVVFVLIAIAIAFQIIQRNRAKKQMRERLHAEQIKEAKLEFFTNISHEIKTPLSLIINPLRKLISDDQDLSRQKVYSVIRRNTEKVFHLVNQLMDLRKIDRGRISLKYQEVDILSFIKKITEIFEEQLQAKEIDFQIHHKNDIPKAWIDPDFFDKPVLNLLSNALKFTPQKGSVHLFVETNERHNGHKYSTLKITCSDTGKGLREEDIEKVFDRFYQTPDNLKPVGNGIGLHLTRSIVELHHGTIIAQNNQNGPGCRFIIEIPLGKDHLTPEEIVSNQPTQEPSLDDSTLLESLLNQDENEAPVKSKGKKLILVVDDDEEIRNYISTELSSGYQTIEEPNGKEGLSAALNKRPDIIISDVMMPEMDGITLCKKVKQNVTINHIPVILLTARTKVQDNLDGLGTGADAYIAKPFNMDILRKTVDNLIKNRELLRNNYSGNQLQKDKVKNIELQSADEKMMRKIMEVINKNISNPELNVEMIASEIGMSRVHLYRKLKGITNQSVRDLIRNIRLEQAAELLASKNINVSEVAYATGFSNPSKFSSSFKELYGQSPKQYMDQHQSEKIEG